MSYEQILRVLLEYREGNRWNHAWQEIRRSCGYGNEFRGIMETQLYYKENVDRAITALQVWHEADKHVARIIETNKLGNKHRPLIDQWVRDIVKQELKATLQVHYGEPTILDRLKERAGDVNLRRLDKGELGSDIWNNPSSELRIRNICEDLEWQAPPPEHGRKAAIYDDTTVFYSRDALDPLRGRVSKMAYTKYFQTFCGVDQVQIRDYQNRKAMLGNIMWAKTREEVNHVYENGPHSCMSYCIDEYETDGIRPVEVYGVGEGGDVAVAYLQDLQGRVIARAVCNMKDKTYPTYYGHAALETALKDNGFKKSCYALDGCKILELRNNNGSLIVPYIDGDNHPVDPRRIEIDGVNYITVDVHGDSDYAGYYETGLANCEGGSGEECYDCGERIYDVEHRDYSGDAICDCCWDNYCEDCRERHDNCDCGE